MIKYSIRFCLHKIKDGIGSLQMRIRWGENSIQLNVGHKVNAGKWDADAQCCINNTTHGKDKVQASIINKDIRRHRNAADEAFSMFVGNPSTADISRSLDEILGRKTQRRNTDSCSVHQALVQFIVTESKLRGWAKNTTQRMQTLQAALTRWNPAATFSDLDKRGLESFYVFLLNEGKKNVTIDKYLEKLKRFLKWANESRNIPQDFLTFKPRIKTIPKTIVWLNRDELLRLYNADLAPLHCRCHNIEEIRDYFCFSCFTGLRYIDIASLQKSSIIGDKIHRTLVKTGEVVSIELNKYSRSIIQKYQDSSSLNVFPYVANPVVNLWLKEICRFVSIDAPVTETYYKGNDIVSETKKKYECLTMHCGRRTFICTALEQGVSPLVVMKWTGHKDYNEMKPYIDISDSAKASAMQVFDRL